MHTLSFRGKLPIALKGNRLHLTEYTGNRRICAYATDALVGSHCGMDPHCLQ